MGLNGGRYGSTRRLFVHGAQFDNGADAYPDIVDGGANGVHFGSEGGAGGGEGGEGAGHVFVVGG